MRPSKTRTVLYIIIFTLFTALCVNHTYLKGKLTKSQTTVTELTTEVDSLNTVVIDLESFLELDSEYVSVIDSLSTRLRGLNRKKTDRIYFKSDVSSDNLAPIVREKLDEQFNRKQ